MSNISLRALTIKYIFALSLIGGLLILSYGLTNMLIDNSQDDASMINLSGRQRMFSQRVALLSVQLVNENNPTAREKIRARLLRNVADMESISRELMQEQGGREVLPSQKFVESHLKGFYSETRALANEPDEKLTYQNPHLRYVVNVAVGDLLISLNSIVREHQLLNEDKMRLLQMAQTATLISGLFVLLLIAIFVFRPMMCEIIEEKTKLEELNEQLNRLSAIDGLTGIPNRRNFDEYYSREWKRALRERSSLAVIMCDIDHFKIYNDTYGHLAGDDCLKEVAVTISETLKRPADLVARYGGEEFVVVLPETDLGGALAIAEKIRLEIISKNIEHIDSKVSDHVTLSLGAASIVPREDQPPSTLVDCADKALYQAKNGGRNQVSFIEDCANCCLEENL